MRDVFRDANGEVALPLYEGRMIGQFDFSKKGWVRGKGRSAVWRDIPWDAKVIEPQYLMAADDFFKAALSRDDEAAAFRGLKIGFMAIGSATNSRSMFCAHVFDSPCGNAVPVIQTMRGHGCGLALMATLNSYSYDYALRARLGGINLNYFVIEETPVLGPIGWQDIPSAVLKAVNLGWPHLRYSSEWLRLRRLLSAVTWRSWKTIWALTFHERLRLRCLLDAVVAELYGLDWDDLAWILRDCDHPIERMRDNSLTRALDPKGFWRVDKEQDPELRHTVLTLAAFHDLKAMIATHGGNREKGIEAFCTQHDGDGWMLPETLRLDDLGLGHDRRAKEPQPVRARLGDRFLPWQLEQSVEDSWAECERHARNILGDAGFAQLQAELRGEPASTKGEVSLGVSESRASYGDDHRTPSLFPDETPAEAPLGKNERTRRRR